MKKINVGIIGFDHVHITKYLPTFASHKQVNLIALAADGPNVGLAKEAAKKERLRFYSDHLSLFKNEKLDAIYIATDPISHLGVVELAAPRGIHILCDKPLATTIEDADKIVQIANNSGINFMVPFNPRFQLPVQQAKKRIESGEIGKVMHIYAEKLGKNPLTIPNFDTAWFADPQRAGFGGFGDIGIHAIDGIRWLADSPVTNVFARIDSKMYGLKVDDFGVMTMKFENGATATLVSGWANPKGFPCWLEVKFEVLGSGGAIRIEKPYHDFWIYDEKSASRKDWFREDITLLVDEFVQSIIENRKPLLDGENALENLKVLLAAYESSRKGTSVDILHKLYKI